MRTLPFDVFHNCRFEDLRVLDEEVYDFKVVHIEDIFTHWGDPSDQDKPSRQDLCAELAQTPFRTRASAEHGCETADHDVVVALFCLIVPDSELFPVPERLYERYL
ncbi:hypothetical protein E3J62_11385 [candidate division TA06 bacterium]|uniref:Uncharacterized protein n=1 Tax=candidate division TA06 bacterium TaxID=2250710 RepID=A0A523UNA5_UNCT6|nr:MAG: hypothetical protein E3J62_11385 [candidate division TA06 bacterium]